MPTPLRVLGQLAMQAWTAGEGGGAEHWERGRPASFHLHYQAKEPARLSHQKAQAPRRTVKILLAVHHTKAGHWPSVQHKPRVRSVTQSPGTVGREPRTVPVTQGDTLHVLRHQN